MNMLNTPAPETCETSETIPTGKPDRSVRNIVLTVLALWLALIGPAMYVLSASPVALRLWLAFLAANLLVWPVVLVAGMIGEAAKSAKASAMLRERDRSDLNDVPNARLAVE